MLYSKRLDRYCNQLVLLEKRDEPDRYGNETYGNPVPIKARKQGGSRLIRNTAGETVACSVTVFSASEIHPMDKVDGAIVVNSAEWVDKDGNVAGWEAYL